MKTQTQIITTKTTSTNLIFISFKFIQSIVCHVHLYILKVHLFSLLPDLPKCGTRDQNAKFKKNKLRAEAKVKEY